MPPTFSVRESLVWKFSRLYYMEVCKQTKTSIDARLRTRRVNEDGVNTIVPHFQLLHNNKITTNIAREPLFLYLYHSFAARNMGIVHDKRLA